MKKESRFYRRLMGERFLFDDLRDRIRNSRIADRYYNIKAFFKNLKLFLYLAYYWRPWDSIYTINALTSLLHQNAKCLRKGYHLNAEKSYRRCMTAAGLIHKAYHQDIDRTVMYLMTKNPYSFNKCRLEIEYNTDKDIYEKMMKIAVKREAESVKRAKKEAWEYLNKYIESFWD